MNLPHPAFPNSRTTASYRSQSAEDVAGALELFRMNYERRNETIRRRPDRVEW
jgi:hypothetical protein